MKSLYLAVITIGVIAPLAALSREAKLVRYPHYHQGHVTFTYLADVWVAEEDGQNIRRLTVHTARDVYPRFSPDGKWIAFSSDRDGNLDVFIIPSEGGRARQLTFHSADDSVLGWSPDSQAVLFASNREGDFTGKLYTVSTHGGMPGDAGADMGIYGCFSPDGRKLAINRKSQRYWRKYYRGSNQSDITVIDLATKAFTKLTDFAGMDRWPMWSRDGFIYFVSDRQPGGQTNIWRIPQTGGQAEPVTWFRRGDVRWPAMSADGQVIVFEHDFGIWKLTLRTKRVTPINLDISAETQESMSQMSAFTSQVDDYDLAPSGRRIVFSIHGEIFTAPVKQGDLKQITDHPARDRNSQYSPDGRWIAFTSDRSGREEMYLSAADGSGKPQKITDLDVLKLSFAWAPDSKEIAFTCSDNKLRKYSLEAHKITELASCRYGSIGPPVWSPDGKWIAYSRPEQDRLRDIYLIPSTGGQERPITFEPFNYGSPRFAPNGKKIYFIRSDGGLGRQPRSQIFALTLEHQQRDPTDPAEPPEHSGNQAGGNQRDRPRGRSQRSQSPPDIVIDWAGLKRRTQQLTHMPFPISSLGVAPDGRMIAFVTNEPAGERNRPVIYSIQDDGKHLTRIASAARPSGGRPGPPGAGGFDSGISSLNISRDGRVLFFKEGKGVYSVPLPSPGDSRRQAGSAAGGGGEKRRRVNFTAKVRIDKPAEWTEMFDDAWRTMKYRFYDPAMHGKDWDAARAKYRPLIQHVGDRRELLNLINEMIGELNASHTGTAPPRQRRAGAVSTGLLGIDLEPEAQAGRYRVKFIYQGGPADKDWVKVKVGDYLIAIQGEQVKAGDNYWPLLNHRLNRKVQLTFNTEPSEAGAWETRIEPITMNAFRRIRYRRWVKERRQMVDKLSGGRIGYLHIRAMNQASLRKFERELRANRGKEALIIDQRWNGGGNIEQQLLALLQQRPYQILRPRGSQPTYRPLNGFFGPKVVLQNWRSGSNAEMFPAGFRALGLGKIIGTPTAGAVIGTGSYRLIDGSRVRTPGMGVYLANAKRTNMENYGVPPDILVENTPEDNLAGRDRQLEVAVRELLKEINRKGARFHEP